MEHIEEVYNSCLKEVQETLIPKRNDMTVKDGVVKILYRDKGYGNGRNQRQYK